MLAAQPLAPSSAQLVALPTLRLADSVYALLRERILLGIYSPGERLAVDRLARDLGVSQTPLKTALGALAVEGLVQVLPRRGTFVTTLSEQDVSESFSIRTALELLAAETIPAHASAADIASLRTLAERTARADSVDEHSRNNAAFHQHLIELSGNRKLAELYRQLNAHIQIALVQSQSRSWRERVPTETTEHAAILEAIQRGDTAGIKQAISQHLHRARGSLVAQVRADSPGTAHRRR